MRLFLLGILMTAGFLNAQESLVEKEFASEIHAGIYPNEKIKVVEVANSNHLGKLTALRFFEWAKHNPKGVVALPTGKTPESFIEYLKYYKANWNQPEVQTDLAKYGMQGPIPPTSNLRFVQLDEFCTLDPTHQNSFANFVKKHYLSTLEIKPSNALLIENRKDEEFCSAYEAKIREWGGIGFFLGGIGVDGHVAFNIPGTSFKSRTHLAKLNYPAAAAAAVSLGGIEYTRDSIVITIGLDTITAREDATLILIAAGEGKAEAVKRAVEGSRDESFPATRFQGLSNTRFYVTKGAASKLTDRKLEDTSRLPITNEMIDEAIIEVALQNKKPIAHLTAVEIKRSPRATILLSRLGKEPYDLRDQTLARLKEHIDNGVKQRSGRRILHTGPHHDDVLLSYYGFLPKLLGTNSNLFVYLTSGFNSVTDTYMKRILHRLTQSKLDEFETLESPYALLLARMLKAARQQDQAALERYEGMFLLRHIALIWNLKDINHILAKANWLLNDYFATKVPGEKDSKEVQILKGAMRESEEDRHMTIQGVPVRDVIHMRSNFYTGDYFTPKPTIEHDATPLLEIYEKFRPEIITVAFDPEGTGPDTHYKVLQVIAQALKLSKLNSTIWAYRNVWHRFSLAEANLIIPVTEKQMGDLHETFMSAYSTQKEASFPSPAFDGPLSTLAIQIQKEQLAKLRILLGPDTLPDAAGVILMKEMTKDDLIENFSPHTLIAPSQRK